MPITQATPYLIFNGDAARAIALYEKALGAKTEALMRFSDMPEGEEPCAPEDAERVMHAMLRVDGATLMISDTPASMPGSTGSNVHILLNFDEVEDMERKFRALAEGGTVQMDLHDAFWGDRFGIVADAHGIHWMFACAREGR